MKLTIELTTAGYLPGAVRFDHAHPAVEMVEVRLSRR